MLEAVTRASFYSKTVTSSYESTVMGKKRKPASTRPATPVGGDIATATRSAYDQGVEANKAQNQRLLDALQAPELTHREGPPPKRCGPSMLTLPGRSRSYAVESRIPLQAEGTEVVCAGVGHTRPRGRHDSETGEGNAEEVRAHASRRVMGLPRAYFDSMYLQEDFGWDYNP